MDSNSEIQRYNVYPMLHFHRKFSSSVTVEWKAKVSRKLEGLSELRELRKDVWRIVVALEKLAGIEGQDSNEEKFL